MDKPIDNPGLVFFEEQRGEQQKDKRVAMTSEMLQKIVLGLFKQKDIWTLEDLASHLNHPKDPIKRLLNVICDLEPIRKWYTLKSVY